MDEKANGVGHWYPQARTPELTKAFRKAGWRALNASNNPKEVKPEACTELPYEDSFTDAFDAAAGDWSTYHRNSFYYNTATRQGKYKNYVHVIGAAQDHLPLAVASATNGFLLGRNDQPSKWTYIFPAYMEFRMQLSGNPKWGEKTVKLVTIHELGHQFGCEHHGADLPAEAVALANYDPNNLTTVKQLLKFRTRRMNLNDPNPEIKDFWLCAMDPNSAPETPDGEPRWLDPLFCEYHNTRIRAYEF